MGAEVEHRGAPEGGARKLARVGGGDRRATPFIRFIPFIPLFVSTNKLQFVLGSDPFNAAIREVLFWRELD